MNIPNIINLQPSKSNKVSLEKFAQYFDRILQETNTNNTCVLYSHFISDYYITIDFTTFRYIIPNLIIERLNNCKTNRTIHYYIIPLILKFNDSDSHANVLIVDNIKKSIELYEPHGSKFSTNDPSLLFDIPFHIKNLIKYILHRRTHFTFINVHESCPIGLQIKQVTATTNSGHCVAWVLFFIHTRLLNLDKTSKNIIDYFNNFTPQKLDLYIRKYTTLIESQTLEIKKYTKDTYVNFTLSNNELVNVKNNIKNYINEYFTLASLNDLQSRASARQGDEPTIHMKNIFNKFIIYSKFDFFDDIYFSTVEKFFNKS